MTIDLSSYAPHVQKAVEELRLSEHALGRAKRGAMWLDTFALPDWRLQMMSIHGGVVCSQIRMAYDTQGPLALAFRRHPQMRRDDDRVRDIDVLEQVRLSDRQAEGFGFWSMMHHTADVIISTGIDGLFLDEAWASILKEMPHREIVPAYPTKPLKYDLQRLVAQL